MIEFTTLEESGLGKFLSALQKILNETQEKYLREFQHKGLEDRVLTDQFKHIQIIITHIKKIASFFENGNKPGLTNFIALMSIKNSLEISLNFFRTSEKKIFIYLEENLLNIVKEGLLAIPVGSSIDVCKDLLKKQIEIKLTQKIPLFNSTKINKIFEIINGIDFSEFLNGTTFENEAFTKKVLDEYSHHFLKNFFDEYQFDTSFPLIVDFLKKVGELPLSPSVEKFFSFLNTDEITIPGFVKRVEGSKYCFQLNDSQIIDLEKFFNICHQEGINYINQWLRVKNENSAVPKYDERKIRDKIKKNYYQQLNNYIKEARHIYILKDLISSNDYEQRIKFIKEIKNLLAVFVETGQKEELIGKLNKDKFPGKNFQSLLNRLNLELNNYKSGPRKNINLTEILDKIRANNEELVKQFDNLYLKIEAIKTHGEKIRSSTNEHGQIAIELSKGLKEKVDRFIYDNQEDLSNKPTAELDIKFIQFKCNFKAHLHSQDDKMSQHRAIWGLVANIAIALGSCFTVTAVQLLRTKWGKEKRATLFFDRTERTKLQEEVDDNLRNLMKFVTNS